ncbi:uncharacterized protein LOC143632075 [Bidens hawaiensis]|uniref:uncharacterized protein LOC143632075 n=1 Tax=Bidens hawaiensis TaxID=980011 RepID=UPI00404940FF
MSQRTEKEEPVPETGDKMRQNRFNATTTTSHRTRSSSLRSPSRIGRDLVLDTLCELLDEELNDNNNNNNKRRRRNNNEAAVVVKKEVMRCSGCQKKVGLTGFRCRCGELFCSEHRYSDRHECGYDYKGVGREAIARENPVVKAAKIDRI